jgi:hypothetical protein
MGFDPNMVQQIPQVIPAPKEILTWTQICYYGAGALVGFAVAYIKVRSILRRRKKENP